MNYFFNQLQQPGGTPFVNTGVIAPQNVDISDAAFAARDSDPLRVALSTVGDSLKENKEEAEKKAEESGKSIGFFSKILGV